MSAEWPSYDLIRLANAPVKIIKTPNFLKFLYILKWKPRYIICHENSKLEENFSNNESKLRDQIRIGKRQLDRTWLASAQKNAIWTK